MHPFFDDDHAAEAVKVVEIACEAQKNESIRYHGYSGAQPQPSS